MLVLIVSAAAIVSGVLFFFSQALPNIVANLNALRRYEYLE
jgi:hypothetical protein